MDSEASFDLVIFKDNQSKTTFVTYVALRLSLDEKWEKVQDVTKSAYSKISIEHENESQRGVWDFYFHIKPNPRIGPGKIHELIHSSELYSDLPGSYFPATPGEHFPVRVPKTSKVANVIEDANDDRRLIAVLTLARAEDYKVTQKAVLAACQDRPAPSSAAHHGTRSNYQVHGNLGAIYDARPRTFFPTPLSLYNDTFYRFTQTLIDNPPEPTHSDLEQAQLFVDLSLRFYNDEPMRSAALSSCLDTLLGTDGTLSEASLPRRESASSRGGCPKADGLVKVPLDSSAKKLGINHATTLICEIKNELGEGSCNPFMQGEEDFIRVCSEPQYDLLCAKTCAPCFLLAISGDCFAIGGIVLADHFISERFTFVTIGPDGDQVNLNNTTRRVAQVFIALRDSLKQLKDFYSNFPFPFQKTTTTASAATNSRGRSAGRFQKFSKSGSGSSSTTSSIANPAFDPNDFPSPSFNQFQTIEGTTWSLKYHGRLRNRSDSIFRATCSRTLNSREKESHTVVVKFTDRYCQEAHSLLATHSLAPKLWYCGQTGGLQVVIMDQIKTVELGLETKRKVLVFDSLKKGLEILHDNEFVHGDMREPNVLITEEGTGMIIDFDWGGKNGEARYPPRLNDDIPWPDGVLRSGIITKEHDDKMLERLKTDWLRL